MSHALIKDGYKQAKRLLLIQFALVVIVSALGLLKEFQISIALLSGGIVVLLSNLYFVVKAFSHAGAQQAKQVLRAFYLGEAVKIMMLSGLIAIAFKLLPGFEMYVLVGYVIALLAQLLAPVIIKTE
ncbi:MAG: ATP synthase subunit I [Methylococcales bacterium]